MPIAVDRKGFARNIANPSVGRVGRVIPFRSRTFSTANTAITGTTKDSAGAALSACVVKLYITGSDALRAQTISDAVGNYRFDNPGSGPFYIVAYKAGAPDIAGTTINTLVAI